VATYNPATIARGEASRLNLGYVNKLLACYRRSSALTKIEGLAWYANARREIRSLALDHGVPFENAAYAVAALSPKMSWKHNLQAVRNLAMGLDAIGMRGPVAQARACLAGDLSALRGAKVTAFAFALTGDSSAAVIDRWMMRAIGSDRIVPTQKQYGKVTKALKVAARMVGLPTSQFQAVVWLQVRNK
jgi:hypothetical protein